jgi:hypothetical protein
MVKKELLKWIESEEAEGFSPKKLSKYLSEKGYSKDEIKEAMEQADKQKESEPKFEKIGKHSKRIYKYIIALVIILLLVYGVMFYFSRKPGGTKEEITEQPKEIPGEEPLINITPLDREQPIEGEIPPAPENLTTDIFAS